MAKSIEAFKLRTELTVDNAKFSAGMKTSEKDVDKLGQRFHKLGPEIDKSLKGKELGARFGQSFSSSASALITGSFRSLGQTLGSIIGTAIVPGLGTAVGSTLGSALDTALEKVSGPMIATIQKGIDLNKQLEETKVEFTTFTGSEKEAVLYLERLKRLSGDAGLRMPFLLDASERVNDFTQDLKLTNTIIRASIEQAADFGGSVGSFTKVADALGLIAEQGDLSGRELKKLFKLGVDAPKRLAEATGMSVAQIKKLMSQGRIEGAVAARLISESILREKAGFAQKLAFTTTGGAERRFEALTELRAVEGTEKATKAIGDFYRMSNEALSSDTAQKFTKFIDQTTGSLIDMVKRGVESGVNLASGIADGISSVESLQRVVGSVTGVGNAAIDTLKDLWQTRSPSKVFKREGINAVEGIEEGLVDRTSKGFDKWGAALEKAGGEAFIRGIAGIAKRLKVDPSWLLNVIAFESEFNPKARNPHSSARGLIQFMNPTARRMGFRTSNEITKLSALDQLPLVEQYLKPFAGKIKNQGALYATIAAGRLPNANDVLFRGGSEEYEANKIWDANKDRIITATEIGALAAMKGEFTVANPMPVAIVRAVRDARGVAALVQADADAQAVAKLIQAGEFGMAVAGIDPRDLRSTAALNRATADARSVAAMVQLAHDARAVQALILAGQAGVPQIRGPLPRGPLPELPGARTDFPAARKATELFKDLAIVMPDLTEKTKIYDGHLRAFTASLALPPVTAKMLALFGAEARKEFALTTEVIKQNQQELVKSISLRDTLYSMISQVAGFLPQQEVGKKRGFFSKLLGFAAPFLSFIPGVGPLLSAIAGIGSAAAAGNWPGVATGVAGGFATGGVFRRSGSGTLAPPPSPAHPGEGLPPRAHGGPGRRGRIYWTGEEGPEPFLAPENGRFLSHRDAMRAMSEERGGVSGAMAQLLGSLEALLSQQTTALERQNSLFARLESMRPYDVVRLGARGLMDAYDQDAGLIRLSSQRHRLA